MFDLVNCKNEEVLIKMKAPESLQHFSHYKSMGIFSRQLTPQPWSILAKFKLIQDIMVVLITRMNED